MRKIIAILLLTSLCLSLTGCDLWMDGSYSSVTPHITEETYETPESVEVESYAQLDATVKNLVESGTASCVLYSRTLTNKQLTNYLNMSIKGVKRDNAIGAWAVEGITYDIGANSGRTAIALKIEYSESRAKILQLKTVSDMTQLKEQFVKAIYNCEAGMVLRVENYSTLDFTQLAQDYMDQNPQTCMEMPQVDCVTYPQFGRNRIVEITFSYKTSRDILRSMQETVQPVFSSAKLYVNQDAPKLEQYTQLYGFLMGRDSYTVQTSITPSYSLLNHGVGDSKAFAVVYAAMCRQSGLDCQVVSGTRGGEAWCWNVILLDEVNYHLDLFQCSQNGGFALKTAGEMTDYVWDYSAYGSNETGG